MENLNNSFGNHAYVHNNYNDHIMIINDHYANYIEWWR